jgi:hypothetical protein
VDRALEAWGMAMGPFRMLDLAGNDVAGLVRKRRAVEMPQMIYPTLPDLILSRGWYGQKTGKGWYDYPPGSRRPAENRELAPLVAANSILQTSRPPSFMPGSLDTDVHAQPCPSGDTDQADPTPGYRSSPERRSSTPISCTRNYPQSRRGDPLPAIEPSPYSGSDPMSGGVTSSAVIVSTARTPMAKSWKGAFNITTEPPSPGTPSPMPWRGRARSASWSRT